MPRKEISLPSGSDASRSRNVLDVSLVNGFAEAVEGSPKARFVICGCDGLEKWIDPLGGLCRGMVTAGDYLFVLSGTTMLRVASDGTTKVLGMIPGNDPVIMARNAASPSQVAIVAGGMAYVATEEKCVLLLKPGILENVQSVTWIDQYFVFTVDKGRFFISGLNTTDVDALDFATAEADPDGIVRAFALGGNLLMFGQQSIEAWVNNGDAAFPFSRLHGGIINAGLGARHSVAQVGDTLAFVDDKGIVRRLAAGYKAERISNYALERRIELLGDYSGLEAFSYTAKGHEFYVLTSPAWTWVFDQTTGKWHERRTGVAPRWQATNAVYFDGRFVVGSRASASLYRITEARYDEDGEPMIFAVRLPVVDAFPMGATVSRLDLDFEVGVGTEAGFVAQPITLDLMNTALDSDKITLDQTIDHRGDLPNVPGKFPNRNPEVMLKWSDDSGRSWSQGLRSTLGRQAEPGRVSFTRLGSFGRQGRIFEVSVSASVFRGLASAHITAEPRTA